MATISTDNYTLGGIDLYFNASVAYASLLATDPSVASGLGGAMRNSGNSIGNVTSAEINPEVTYIEHYVNDCGKKKKDKTSAQLSNVSIPLTFDEMNYNNLKRFFMASYLGSTKMAVLEEPLVEGSAQFVFKTDVGVDMTYFIPKCTLRPDGALTTSMDDWWTAPLVLDVLYYNTGSWASKPYGMVLASAIGCT
jgi:hypothetical protein